MKNFRSIKFKLLFSFLFIGIVPFLVLFLFSIHQIKKAIYLEIKNDLKYKNSYVSKTIETYFRRLKKDIYLWSNYQIMNDIVVDDIDKRIAIFIKAVKLNLSENFDLDIIVTTKTGKIIASTNKKFLFKKFPVQTLLSNRYMLINFSNGLYIFTFSPVYSSFQHKLIGYLIVLINPDTFKKFISTHKGYNVYIYLQNINNKSIDKEILEKIKTQEGFSETQKYFLYTSVLPLELFSEKIYVISLVFKEIAFSTLHTLKESLIFIGFIGFIAIILLSLMISKIVINPLEELTKFADDLAINQNYSKRFNIKSKDEIGILATSFNKLLSKIEYAVNELQKESEKRLLLFTQLVEFFNKLTKTETKSQVIDLLNNTIGNMLGYKVYIKNTQSKEIKNNNCLCFPITYKRFDKKESSLQGYLYFEAIDKKIITEQEKRLLDSVSKLVNLWLERLEMIKTLKKLLEKAQSSSKAKSIFIANVSHELRTPLNSIIGFSQILEEELHNEEYREMVKAIKVSSNHLLSLINDILDFAKAEANKIQVNNEKFLLDDLLEELYLMTKSMIGNKNIKLIFPKKTNITLYTDKKLLKQILINILSNAVKFTNYGYIKVDAEHTENFVKIIVKDTGIGIPQDSISRIFNDFEQVENPLQKKYKGTGLGLALVKRLIKLLNGKVEVKSEGIGKGTTFIVYVPIQEKKRGANAPQS